MSREPRRYPLQAVLVYLALGAALGMVGWAILIHDGGGDGREGDRQLSPVQQER